MELNGLKFKSTNLTELRDESFYMKLKEETQCEFFLLVFVYNIVRFHLSFMIRDEYDEQIKYLKAQGIGEDCLRKIMYEVEGFKKFIKLEKNRDRLKRYQADYYLKNIDKLKEYKRNWYQSTRKESK